jgi:Predicted phage phi-C31 gp36 major capsid-like protein
MTTKYVATELREKRAATFAKMQEAAETARAKGWTDELRKTYDAAHDELRGLAAEIAQAEASFPGESRDSSGSAPSWRRSARSGSDSGAMRVIDELHRDGGLSDVSAEITVDLLRRDEPEPGMGSNRAAAWVTAAGSLEYRQAFAKIAQDPQRGHLEWTPEEHAAYQRAQQVMRALSLDDTGGGHLVPLSLDPAIQLTSEGSISPMRRISRNVLTTTDSWKGITSSGSSAEWKEEGQEVGDGTFEVAGPEIPVHLYDCFVPFSVEIQMDARDFEEQVRAVMLDNVDQLHAAAWINGTGVGQPTGLITALDGTSSEVAPGSSEAFTASTDVYRTIEALRPRSRARAQWLAELSTINRIAQAESGNGARLFPEVSDGRLMMRALNEDSNMDPASGINTGATADNHVLVAGDFRHYVIANRIGTRMELIPHLFGTQHNRPTLQRGFVLWGRVGADVLVNEAFAVLNVATTA